MADVLRPAPRALNLPDFCAAQAVLAVVLIVTLTAIVLTVAHQSSELSFWLDLARTSLFMLWTGMGSAAALCLLRKRLAQMPLGRRERAGARQHAGGDRAGVAAAWSGSAAVPCLGRARPTCCFPRARGTSSPRISASVRSSPHSRCAISTSPANGAATSSCRRARACARCRRASGRTSCSTA